MDAETNVRTGEVSMSPDSQFQGDLNFDGVTAVAELDQKRLTGQMRRVFDVMEDGKWRTLEEIRATSFVRGLHVRDGDAHNDSEAAISARLRDLRKSRFGGFTVDRRRRGDPGSGLFEYRVTKGENVRD